MHEVFGRHLTREEAESLGYTVEHERDGNVMSMTASSGYRITYGAPSYISAVKRADEAKAPR